LQRVGTGIPFIESIQNPKIKSALDLRESRSRRQRGEFLVEGRRELTRALDSGVRVTEVFVGEDFFHLPEVMNLVEKLPESIRLTRVSKRVYEKLALREGTEGFVAVAQNQDWKESEIIRPSAVLVIVDGLEKPGNIGAILRSMDGASASGLLISSETSVDVYNPNIVRASQGAVFSIPTKIMKPAEIVFALKTHDIRSYALDPHASDFYFNADIRSSSAIVVGNEAHGLSEFWRKSANGLLKIPMNGICDSLNASVSTAVVLYESLRQRSNHG
jgi:TrmH family RNA methyltransferase